MTCRFDRAKSTIFSPRPFLIYASRIFHSRGMVQSKTWVPVGTSCTSSLMCALIARKVSRTPRPVMLRQIGYIFATRAKISSPMSSVTSCSQREIAHSLHRQFMTPPGAGAATWRNSASRIPSANNLLMWAMRWYRGPSNSSNVRPDER